MKKIWLALIVVVVMVGCAPSGKWINVNYKAIDPAPGGYLKSYILGQSKTAFIGQEIINVAKCDSFQKAVWTNQIVSITGRDRYVKEHKYDSRGTFPITGTVDFDGKTSYVMKPGASSEWGILISDSGDIYNNSLYGYSYQLVYLSDSFSISPNRYEFSAPCVRQSNSAVSFDLIYAGKNDISLNATYREFSVDNLARPAFFQNITYQADAKQIRFKNFLIRIDEVSNEKITYTVLEDGLK